jgi:hypothetical protein
VLCKGVFKPVNHQGPAAFGTYKADEVADRERDWVAGRGSCMGLGQKAGETVAVPRLAI